MSTPLSWNAEVRTFRRAFLWTLAACGVAAALRADDRPRREVIKFDPPAGAQVRPQQPAPLQPAPLQPVVGDRPALALPAGPLVEAEATQVLEPPAPAPAVDSPLTAPETSVPAGTVTHFPDENWTVTILPRNAPGVTVRGLKYEEVYASIPYRQAEYLANPGYRHEAAMEVMFGQLRPKTVVSQYSPQTVPVPKFSMYKPYRYSQTELNYLNGPLGFGSWWSYGAGPYYPSYPRYPMLY